MEIFCINKIYGHKCKGCSAILRITCIDRGIETWSDRDVGFQISAYSNILWESVNGYEI